MDFKKNIFSLVILSYNLCIETAQDVHYILKIKGSSQIPKFCGYFKGYKLELDNGFCMFWQPKKIENFILVITEQVVYKSKAHNIKYLERINKKPCRLFFIDSIYDNETKINKWKIEEEKFENLPLRLPESAIVILMNPNYIDSIQTIKPNKLKKIDNEDSLKVINLPEIILKKGISQKELQASSMLSLLSAIDNNAIHVNQKKEIIRGNGVVLALNN